VLIFSSPPRLEGWKLPQNCFLESDVSLGGVARVFSLTVQLQRISHTLLKNLSPHWKDVSVHRHQNKPRASWM
jgi:hypothetical protein